MFGALAARRVHGLDVGGDAEGCVADDALGHFYISEEEHAIWKYGAEPGAGTKRTLVDAAGARGDVTADLEGPAIAEGPRGTGWLVAAVQGSDSYAVLAARGRQPIRPHAHGGSGARDRRWPAHRRARRDDHPIGPSVPGGHPRRRGRPQRRPPPELQARAVAQTGLKRGQRGAAVRRAERPAGRRARGRATGQPGRRGSTCARRTTQRRTSGRVAIAAAMSSRSSG